MRYLQIEYLLLQRSQRTQWRQSTRTHISFLQLDILLSVCVYIPRVMCKYFYALFFRIMTCRLAKSLKTFDVTNKMISQHFFFLFLRHLWCVWMSNKKIRCSSKWNWHQIHLWLHRSYCNGKIAEWPRNICVHMIFWEIKFAKWKEK